MKNFEYHFNMVSWSGSKKNPVPVKGIKVADHDIFKTILKDNFEKVADGDVSC